MLQAPSSFPAIAAGDGACAANRPNHKPHLSNSFERLVRIYQDGEMLLVQMRRVNARLKQARQYLASEGCNRALGQALVDRLLSRRSWLVDRLQANRLAALAVLEIPYTQNQMSF